MEEVKLQKRIESALNQLKDPKVRTIILKGENERLKTWMAKEICGTAVSRYLFDGYIWLNMNKKYDERSLLEDIACQLSLLSISEELEDEDDDEQRAEQKRKKKEEEEKDENLKRMMSDLVGKKSYLLILDNEPSVMHGHPVIENFETYKMVKELCKVSVTTCKHDSGEGSFEIEVKSLSEEESLSLLEERAHELRGTQESKEICNAIIKKSEGLPAAIVVIAEALGYIARHNCEGWTLQRAFERAKIPEGGLDDLFRCGYEMLPTISIKNCCWYSRELIRNRGGIHYSELIAFWIMEGYISVSKDIKKAYMEGHDILLQLVDRGMLKMQEGNILTMEEELLKADDDRYRGFCGTASLGLANLSAQGKGNIELGRIVLADGMVKSPCGRKEWEKLTTLLIETDHLCREDPEQFFSSLKQIQVLAIFKPRFKSLPLSLPNMKTLSKMKMLQVIVLRGCELLEDMDKISELESLRVLEISASHSLKTMPHNFFNKLPHLQSLNLSESQIEYLPILDLPELRWLILRRCSHLQKLPNLKNLRKLEVLDVSGSTSLIIKEKFSSTLKELQLLDLSDTQISSLPVINGLQKLERLFLRNCKSLSRLPSLPPNLLVVDLSGCTSLGELKDKSFEGKHGLKVLNLSCTQLNAPPLSSSLSKLFLSGCPMLTKLPKTAALKHLEVLDLSGASALDGFIDSSFEHLECLQVLNLSETKITAVPAISNLSKLYQLLLAKCECLVQLPQMNGVDKLEVLDLSGCKALTGIPKEPLEHMSCLLKLNLSGACNGKEVDCTHLEQVTSLKILNLSGISIGVLPDLSKLTNLVELDLSGANVKELPCGTPELTSLKRVILPDLKDVEWWKLKHIPEEIICSSVEENCKNEVPNRYLDKLVRDVYSKTKHFHCDVADEGYLQIRGFSTFPDCFRSVLKCAKNLHFVDISFMSSLSDLSCFDVKDMKGCWLDRCTKMESILGEEKDVKMLENLETLWVSNLPHLKRIQAKPFSKLKYLFLDCCPLLVNVFSSSQLPENLEVLKIKFCDQLETVFGGEKSSVCTSEKLHTLQLHALPELRSIGGALPPLKHFSVKECPKLNIGDENITIAP